MRFIQTQSAFRGQSGGGLTMRRVDSQVDGHGGDALVGPGDSVSLCLDLLPHLIEIYKLFALTVEELSIFWKTRVKREKLAEHREITYLNLQKNNFH